MIYNRNLKFWFNYRTVRRSGRFVPFESTLRTLNWKDEAMEIIDSKLITVIMGRRRVYALLAAQHARETHEVHTNLRRPETIDIVRFLAESISVLYKY